MYRDFLNSTIWLKLRVALDHASLKFSGTLSLRYNLITWQCIIAPYWAEHVLYCIRCGCFDKHSSLNISSRFCCTTLLFLTTVNGQWGEWSEFGRCSVTCGPGMMLRTRLCDSPAQQGTGLPCSGSPNSTAPCQEWECGQPREWFNTMKPEQNFAHIFKHNLIKDINIL